MAQGLRESSTIASLNLEIRWFYALRFTGSGIERVLRVERRISEMITESKKFALENEKSLADVREKSDKLKELYSRMEKTCQNQKYLLRLKEEKIKAIEAAKDSNCQQKCGNPGAFDPKEEEIQVLKNLVNYTQSKRILVS